MMSKSYRLLTLITNIGHQILSECTFNHDVLFFSCADAVHKSYPERYNFNFVVLDIAYMYVQR